MGDQTELEHGLGFCVLAGKARALQEKSGVAATQKTKEELREELVNILLKIAAEHLASDAPQPVVLANQVLREELAERLPQLGLKSSEAEVTSAVDDVWSARNEALEES